jgi:hypothetical protein
MTLTLQEEQRLRTSENRVLGRIFGHKKEEVTKGLRKCCNEELHNLYSSPIIRVFKRWIMRWQIILKWILKK